MPQITLGQKTVSYTIRRSERAQRVSLKIDPRNGLQLILPARLELSNLDDLIQEKQSWILKHLRDVQPRLWLNGEKILYLGEEHELEVMPTQTAKLTTVARQAHTIRVRLRGGMSSTDQPAEVKAALENWYRIQAKRHISQRTAELATQFGFKYERISIKGQRTRWGSCSSEGNLNFNWRLMMAPCGAIDYVIIHELCHLRELNHSERFWALVEKYCPAYFYWMRWLDEHSPALYL